MTEEIICRYKFQNNEKFNGKSYCTLHNELCENLSFVCDKNCQVYEDYKQFKCLKQENEELKELKDETYFKLKEEYLSELKRLEQERDDLQDRLLTLAGTYQETRNVCKRLEQENKVKSRKNELANMAEQANMRIDAYRSALEEIRVIADDTFKVCDDDCGNARKIKLIIDRTNEVLSS